MRKHCTTMPCVSMFGACSVLHAGHSQLLWEGCINQSMQGGGRVGGERVTLSAIRIELEEGSGWGENGCWVRLGYI